MIAPHILIPDQNPLSFMNSPVSSAQDAVPDVAPRPSSSPRALLKSLEAQFPVFRASQPLAIGIDKVLLQRLPGLEKKVLRIALSLHTHTLRYLRGVEKSSHRFDLEGNPAEAISDEHRQHASETIRERLKKQAEERRAKQQAAEETARRVDPEGHPAEATADEARQRAPETPRARPKKPAKERRAPPTAAEESDAARVYAEKLAQLAAKFARR
jgi:ProP effector